MKKKTKKKYAFVTESSKEYNCAKLKQSGPYLHPTMQQCSDTKVVVKKK